MVVGISTEDQMLVKLQSRYYGNWRAGSQSNQMTLPERSTCSGSCKSTRWRLFPALGMKTKYLIETSAIRAAMQDTTPAHAAHFAQLTADGELWVSVYIRKEFIRRWVCDAARMAMTIAQCSTVDEALTILEQDFSIRSVKGTIATLASYLRERGQIFNTRAAAEEVASLALRKLKMFDKVFPSRVNNKCRCQAGTIGPNVDYNALLTELHVLYERFMATVRDCGVNSFLHFSRPRGSLLKLLNDAKVLALSVGQRLSQLQESGAWITCRECARIGDVIIALEQPSSWCLVHIDAAFNDLCQCLGTKHVALASVKAVAKMSEHAPRPTDGTPS